VQTLLRPGVVKAKLALGASDDPEEREADVAAERVMRSSGGACCSGCASGRGCEATTIRRQPTGPAAPRNLPADLEAQVQQLTAGGTPMSPALRALFEPRLGRDLGDVRLHTDAGAAASARAVGARAYTVGNHVAFGDGQWSPETAHGRRLLAHELAHVALGHGGIRRVGDGFDPYMAQLEYEMREQERAEARARAERHARWKASAEARFGQEIAGQSGTIGEERERASQGLVAQRIAMLNEVAQNRAWLDALLAAYGYQGPTITDVRDTWAGARLSVDALELTLKTGEAGAEAEVAASAALAAFYETYQPYAEGMDTARKNHVERKNAERLEQWESAREMVSQELVGEPGAGAFRGGWALANPRPALDPVPAPVAPRARPALERALAAHDLDTWTRVLTDFAQITRDLDTLLLFALPERSTVRQGFEYLQALEERLTTLEREHPVIIKIPAVFYPRDKLVEAPGEGAEKIEVAEGIPWQFYLYHTGVRSHEQLAVSGGEWVLVDVTSPKQMKSNRASSTDIDAALLQQGAAVDPPLDMFEELNHKLRFPKGQLFWRMPKGQHYTLETTEPRTLSDWLGYLGMALAAIAIVAAVVASGGTAAPVAGAIATWAGVGAGLAGIGSTLADLDDKRRHGMLTEEDIDRAMLSIGIDLIGMASLGLGRIVSTGAKGALAGSRYFFGLRVAHRVVQAGAVAGDVVQVMTATADFLTAYRAIENNPNMTPDERSQAKAKLVRSALLTGVLLTVALKGDINDMRPGRTLHVTGVDGEGNLLVRPDPVAPDPHARPDPADVGPGVGTAVPHAGPHTAPHGDVHGPVQAHAGQVGASVHVAGASHAVGVGGTGPTRGFYFCSDFCTQIADRLASIVGCLPRNYPGRGLYTSIQRRARIAGNKLAAGELTDAEANALATGFAEEIGRHAAHDPVFRQLLQMHPTALASNADAIHGELLRELEFAGSVRGDFEAAAIPGHVSVSTPGGPPARPGRQRDVLELFGVSERDRPGGRLQPLHFDVGNFGHTYAEVLVPGLPKGLSKEVVVTVADGSVGRADRVAFRYDADGRVIGGRVYEVKPNTAYWRRAGAAQGEEYARALEVQYGLKPGSFDSRVVTYDRDAVTELVKKLRELPVGP
jgi:hypothetical protein